ncbi:MULTISPECIES: 3-oxoacyl-[acyl-carrier-protein] reductase [Oceanobacillus]|uniref:3-oxoacyl-[acyl-carrier-protein] reductase n=1 Tax=Oceanobacillus kimchii TaxID=746691 RepID=A0ABQ5THN5_9BACI|nr:MULTISPECIES: 3-oxoacyl-[acyl-carrier-protein] reductase [Oceanobacillus]MBT2598743.1 3-oxoacyl-[acyl-carrier-protein] reductase [Oceanobacillus sp. ISL-74]MBT2651662.1 3-oxoacyl-[acyl-carrier-protein] reductase [Oceanobacillus sp. ISL-73]MCT1576311.1 3-oxoacyl-[acyl-carrier-protein] reductase [Oceanobacillus kimchii]MCT2135947.1 3-oxoacyl-[acyl-carrier-protein] reductase [Oceanobacillus kimchii]OEH54628.1 beta-ketoacyl-ACP reductase [Oceanobacillus sp. E9]
MLQGKNAIVTGASRGIGRSIALELAKQGANVVVNYAGSEAKAEEVVQEAISFGVRSFKVQTDISNESEVKEMMKSVTNELGSIDILVNNAGITKDNLLMRMKEDEFDQVVQTNLKGTFLCTKAVTRQMMKQKSGRIINVASIVGVSGNPGQANYVAAKAGVIGLTKTTAKELASRNILVNAVAPGFISTDMTDRLSEEQQDSLLNLVPLERFGKPEDVARVVRFLATEDANYITGQTIHIDGGMVM